MTSTITPGNLAGALGVTLPENARVVFATSPELPLSVREFRVEEGISQLFRVRLACVSAYAEIDLSNLVGDRAAFELSWTRERRWRGLCDTAEFVRVSEHAEGLATYEITLVPTLWRLTQRVQNRLFQHISIPTIVSFILDEWHIEHAWRIEAAKYPPLELRTQYGESDFAFVSRLLEEAGISYYFIDEGTSASTLVLRDDPQNAEARDGAPIRFVDDVTLGHAARGELVTNVRLKERSKPGRFTVRDHDFMRPRQALFNRAEVARPVEHAHEQYFFRPGVGVAEQPSALSPGAPFPTADELGVARWRNEQATLRVQRALEAAQSDRRVVTYETSACDLSPGVVFRIGHHPRADLREDQRFLVVGHVMSGKIADADPWHFTGAAVNAGEPFRSPQVTPKPRTHGLQTAVVVGSNGEGQRAKQALDAALPGAVGKLASIAVEGGNASEALPDNAVYVDEHGRVRVQFPWDREHSFNKQSSVWTRVSQGWAGAGYGLFTIPRVGHEVLIAFLDGDPDCPMIVGRVHNSAEPPPYPLPASKTVSTWKTASSPSGDGFNELRFEDASSREHVYLQAEKDMDHLVKNDLKQAVGGDSTRFVQTHDTHAVGGSRSDFVNVSQANAVGMNQASFVGMHRTSHIGIEDTTMVGTRWAVTVARGMTSRLVQDLEQLAGSVGNVLRSKATSVLGTIPVTPLSEAGTTALAGLGLILFEGIKALVETTSTVGRPMEQGPAPTVIEMVDRQIRLTTGEASIVLDGPNITMTAQGTIVLHAMDHVSVLSEKEIAIGGRQKVALVSAESEVIVQAKTDLHLNPYDKNSKLKNARPLAPPDPDLTLPLPESCAICGAPLSSTAPWERSCSAVEAMVLANGAPSAGDDFSRSGSFAEVVSLILTSAQEYGMRGDIMQHGIKAIAEGFSAMSPSYARTLQWLVDYRHMSRADFDRIQSFRLEDAQDFVGFSLGFWVPGADAPMSTSFSFGGPSLQKGPVLGVGQINLSVHLPLGIHVDFHDRTALESFVGFMKMETVTHV